ncbi:MAG: Unknown protein [uncultured Thiotrichaceae bacterium]|uniref:GST N-terminal domain-containing protein n=1 Tax=uncultured Thiotrichaceae bacterium TaxID=298394 RepID=A0A6S6UIK1_9GAMM|nr:MAG: Unknown protein [uncultured Thiotrichaceae bacterium]
MITLYQFDSCPFCWKVKALLNFAKQPYDIVEVSPFGMKELNFTDHKKVPVLRDDDEIITESSTIVNYVNDFYSKLPKQENSEQWSKWVDDVLVHYLPPLIHPNFKTSLHNFHFIMQNGSMGFIKKKLTGFMGAMVMPKVARKMKIKHRIDDTEAEFKQAIDKWVNDGLAGKDYFGGETPDFIDCSVFGVLHSSHNLGVIQLASDHNSDFAEWYRRCLPHMTK